jgi:nicotinamidase-related amidase
MHENLAIDKSRTAIVVIDLQKGIVARPAKPYSSGEVIANASKLVSAFRKFHMPVFSRARARYPGYGAQAACR